MIIVYIDGLISINPGGIATYSFIIYKNGNKIFEKYDVIEKELSMSNNYAEYYALYSSLKFLLENNMNNEEIIIKSDSQLLVNQMKGLWKAHKGSYYSLYLKTKELLKEFSNIKFIWIPREENEEADRLSKKAYEEYLKSFSTNSKNRENCSKDTCN
jgi:ribonuclease HI